MAEARAEDRLRVRLMRDDLFELLQQHADARRLMRHLGLVERTLRKQGWDAVESLPAAVIAKALAQLELLVRDWSPAGLAEVRSRLAMILKSRPAESAAAELDGDHRARFERGVVTFDDVEIDDLHRAEFEEMERSWAGRIRNARPPGES